MASDTELVLLDGTTGATGAAQTWYGGRGVFCLLSGTLDGATVKLQWSPDGGTTWCDCDRSGETYVTYSTLPRADGSIELPVGKVRAFVSGGTVPANLKAVLKGTRVS